VDQQGANGPASDLAGADSKQVLMLMKLPVAVDVSSAMNSAT